MDLQKIAKRLASAPLSVPRTEQSPSMCGPASLSAVLAFFGVQATEDALRELSGATEEDGVEVNGMVKAAEAFGFETWWTENATIDQIRQVVGQFQLPVLVEWFKRDGGHWSVITGINDGTIYMMDPSNGEDIIMPVDQFEHIWFDFSSQKPEPESMTNRLMLVVRPRE